VKDIPGVAEIVIVTGAAMVDYVARQTPEIDTPVTILVEPEAATAPRPWPPRRLTSSARTRTASC
jgi:hypothetical protein